MSRSAFPLLLEKEDFFPYYSSDKSGLVELGGSGNAEGLDRNRVPIGSYLSMLIGFDVRGLVNW